MGLCFKRSIVENLRMKQDVWGSRQQNTERSKEQVGAVQMK